MHSVLLGITAVFMVACYVISAREEEKLLAQGAKADEYAALRARTWRLIPFIY